MSDDELEPAAWLVKCECDDQWTHLIDNPENLPYVPDYCPDCESRLQPEPLVRLSDATEARIRELEQIRERLLEVADQPDVETFKREIRSGIAERIRQLERDITQHSEGENSEK